MNAARRTVLLASLAALAQALTLAAAPGAFAHGDKHAEHGAAPAAAAAQPAAQAVTTVFNGPRV